MSVSLHWTGLNEFKEALRRLPEDLRDEAQDVVENAAERTAARLFQSYPLGDTGNLRKGVSVGTEKGAYGVRATVRSRSPHAHLWEFGTQSRRTTKGWNRGRGPAHFNQGLVGISIQERQKMLRELIALVQRAGFEVTGGTI